MTTDKLKSALVRMAEYADLEADRFASELIGDEE
jgi:hypothetical protein